MRKWLDREESSINRRTWLVLLLMVAVLTLGWVPDESAEDVPEHASTLAR